MTRHAGAIFMGVIALVAALCVPASAQTPAHRRVLIMPFAVQVQSPASGSSSAWLGEAATILSSDRFRALGIDTFTREDRLAVLDRLQLPAASALSRATTIRTAELIGASEVVIGDIRVGQTLSVHAQIIRLGAGERAADIVDKAAATDVFALFDRVGTALAQSLGATPRPGQAIVPRPPLDAFENYVRGLVAVTPAAQQRFLEAAYRMAPRDARILMALSSVYTEEGLHPKALAAARNVPADSPLWRKARFSSALSLIELARLDEAAKALTDLNAEHASPALWNALGIVQLRRGVLTQGEPAASFFKKAVDAAPEDTDYLFNLGYAYALTHDHSSALFWLREAVRFDAANGDAHLVMSAVLDSTGKTVEAQRELELAKLLGTRRNVAASGLSDRIPLKLERLRTDFDGTAWQGTSALAMPAQREQQQVATFHVGQARKLIADRKDRDAIDELRRAIYLSPYQDEPHLLLGRLYERATRLPEAIDEFKVAIWCRETVDARVALGAALLESGDKVGARREAQRALTLQPASDVARALLAKIDG